MPPRIVSTLSAEALPAAISVLQAGGILAFPTDTVYGLGALGFHTDAIERLYVAKDRDYSKPIALLIGQLDDLARVTPGLPPAAMRLAARFWPGALTLVVPRHPELPANLSSTPTIGIRMPDHPFALALLKASGPLAVTSANRSGAANPLTAADVLEQLGERIDLLCDGGPTSGGIPSTVVDCTGTLLKILRQGALTAEQIQQVAAETL